VTGWRQAGPLTPAADLQQRLWDSDPGGWALFAEPHTQPLFEALLEVTSAAAGTRLLDVGCGSGLMLALASRRGAAVTGVDVAPGLLTVARGRLPDAELWLADMEQLPFPGESFDVIVGVNSFQFAGDPRRALREAARVCRPGGAVAVAAFAEPERSESTAVHLAMSALSPPERQTAHAPYSLSAPGNLESGLADAGLRLAASGEVECVWRYGTLADARRGLLSSAGGARAAQDSGREAVSAAIEPALAPFTDPVTGIISMRNVFRWACASKPSARKPGTSKPRASKPHAREPAAG
jgi:SAM-dependent methyltransferase